MSSKTQMIPIVTGCMPSYEVDSLLDCACGFGKWAGILRTHLNQIANSYIVGLDIFRDNLEFVKKYGAYDDLILADIRYLPFKKNSFKVVLATEVIEHIIKEEGYKFLKDLETLCFGRVIVTTPNGSWPENPIMYKNGKVNKYENHVSMWAVNDFSVNGYRVHSIGLRVNTQSKNFLINQIISGLDFLLFPGWVIPNLGKHLVAYKDTIKNKNTLN